MSAEARPPESLAVGTLEEIAKGNQTGPVMAAKHALPAAE
jgi:hypothetical protein